MSSYDENWRPAFSFCRDSSHIRILSPHWSFGVSASWILLSTSRTSLWNDLDFL